MYQRKYYWRWVKNCNEVMPPQKYKQHRNKWSYLHYKNPDLKQCLMGSPFSLYSSLILNCGTRQLIENRNPAMSPYPRNLRPWLFNLPRTVPIPYLLHWGPKDGSEWGVRFLLPIHNPRWRRAHPWLFGKVGEPGDPHNSTLAISPRTIKKGRTQKLGPKFYVSHS